MYVYTYIYMCIVTNIFVYAKIYTCTYEHI